MIIIHEMLQIDLTFLHKALEALLKVLQCFNFASHQRTENDLERTLHLSCKLNKYKNNTWIDMQLTIKLFDMELVQSV